MTAPTEHQCSRHWLPGPLARFEQRGVGAGVLILAMSTPALADTRQVVASTVTLAPTERPGAVAEVQFNNSRSDGGFLVTHEFTLTLDGVTVAVVATVGRTPDPDTITVTAPEGYAAIPRELTIPDGDSGAVYVYPLNGVGM